MIETIYQSKKILLTGLSELLGSQPADPELFSNYIASRAPEDDQKRQEIADRLKTQASYDGLEDRGTNVFTRDPKSGALMMRGYQMCGFFKEAFKALEDKLGILQAASKVDRFLFCEPRSLLIKRDDGSLVTVNDGTFQRPIRFNVMGKDMTSLVASEMINLPWQFEIEIFLIPNKGTPKSKPITWEAIQMALDYGRLRGVGHFRNGMYGRFEWKEL